MKAESREYYAARERAERAAAENATTTEARRAHEALARAYAQLSEVPLPEEQDPGVRRPAA